MGSSQPPNPYYNTPHQDNYSAPSSDQALQAYSLYLANPTSPGAQASIAPFLTNTGIYPSDVPSVISAIAPTTASDTAHNIASNLTSGLSSIPKTDLYIGLGVLALLLILK